MISTAKPAVSIDLTEIGRKYTRDWLRGSIEASGQEWRDFHEFWDLFLFDGPGVVPPRTLVVGDLSRIAKHYRTKGGHQWITSVRRTRPIFLALVRTRKDEGVASLIDDILRDSDLRMIVCRDRPATGELRHCLTEALTALEPDSILVVRYSPPRDNLWVQFGDGLSGTVDWSTLGVDDLRDTFVAESASIGESGKTIALTRTDGDLLEIDSASIRGVLDQHFGRALRQEAAESDWAVGIRLREARERAAVTQVELSVRTGIDQAVISRLERGKHRPRIDTLRRIASALDLTVPQLLQP